MISSITEYLEELKEVFVPTVARAEDDVEDKAEDDGDDDDEEDEEEDEDELADQFETLRAESATTPEGEKLKHHYMECVERVQKAQEQPDYDNLEYKEDCVEEFFHLQHYLDSHAAPRLFGQLK